MTQSFINPLSKFTSDTLKTLPYSRLYFFENESSTPKEIFKDKAKTISWGVYAEADSAGNFPPIWFDGICRATLKWSSNWLTDPVGVVQTQWPIDNIGTDQSFDTDVTIAGDLTANNVYSEGVVQAAGNAGFQSTEYTLNARNPIWSFGNADTYGISYFAGTPSIGADDKIGIHFGTATLLGSEFTFNDDGNFNAIGAISGQSVSTPTATITTITSTTVNATTVNAGTINTGNVVGSGGATFAGGVTSNSSLYAPNLEKVRKKTALTLRASTTVLAADPDLSIPLLTSSWYKVSALIAWDGGGSTTNGIKIRVGVTNAALRNVMYIASTNTGAANTAPVSNTGGLAPSGFDRLPSAASVVDTILIEAVVLTSASGSPAVFIEWAQSSSNATPTNVNDGSILTALLLP